MTVLISELSMNFLGDLSLAEEMIVAAAENGADYVKFQTWKVDNLKPGSWDTDGRRDVYKKAELSMDDYAFLLDCCKNNGVQFLTSVFSEDLLEPIRAFSDSVKIASTESCNTNLVKKSISMFDTVYISVGATNAKEYNWLAEIENVYLLHCVSKYPCDAKFVNLPKLDYIKTITPRFGYSGHYFGIWDAIAAISMGAKVVEKHFTTNRGLPFRDNKFALLPDELRSIREYASEFDKMNIDHGINMQEDEELVRKEYAGRWNKNQ